MGFDRLPRALRLGLYGLATAILLYLCLAPSHDLPSVNLWDKAEHAIAWAVLAGTGFILFPRHRRLVIAFALALGALVEVLQGLLPALGRDADWKDWVADLAGVGGAALVWGLLRRTPA